MQYFDRRGLLRRAFYGSLGLAGLPLTDMAAEFPIPEHPAALSVQRFVENPIIRPEMLPAGDGNNINGPSLIRTPEWISEPAWQILPVLRGPRGQIHPPGLCGSPGRTVEGLRAWDLAPGAGA